MIIMNELPDSAALHAVEYGEFPSEITEASESVAVVMTQSWCPDWLYMRSWLARSARKGVPADRDITVFTIVYDKVSYGGSFRRHKETRFGNYLIPYVRFYRSGRFVGDGNVMQPDDFLKRFPVTA